ncbi:alpha/beta fold hydrolase [Salinicoccus luteus]|uniref:alpha/beta fold hydrolase n=1 Tax=Salinicoccus luteus TaxID=367840 RepID=UPI0004E0D2EC|nr:alpha/beta hydrolase [Salinicoccus luteus]
MMNIDFEHIKTNGVELHVAVSGPEEGDLVILLHGFPEFWFSWRRQIRELAGAGYRVIAPDQRGYNKSDKPDGVRSYDIDTLRDDIIGLIHHFGHKAAAIIGHDWGGAVGWHLAATRPGLVRGFVAINMPHLAVLPKVMLTTPLQWLRSSYMLFFQTPKVPEKILSRNDYRYMEQALRTTSKKGTFTEEELGAYKIAWARPKTLTSMLNWYRAMPFSMKSVRKGNIEVPVKIIWGEGDQFLSTKLAEESLKFTDSNSVIWVEDATHWVHQEKPDFVNDQLIHFLDKTASRVIR